MKHVSILIPAGGSITGPHKVLRQVNDLLMSMRVVELIGYQR